LQNEETLRGIKRKGKIKCREELGKYGEGKKNEVKKGKGKDLVPRGGGVKWELLLKR